MRPLFVAGGEAPKLLTAINQPFNPVALALHLIGSRRQLEAEITNEAEQQQIAEIKAKLFSSKETTDGQSNNA